MFGDLPETICFTISFLLDLRADENLEDKYMMQYLKRF